MPKKPQEWRAWAESTELEDWEAKLERLLEALERDPHALGPVGNGSIGAIGAVFVVEAPDAMDAIGVATSTFRDALRRADPRADVCRFELAPADDEAGVDLLGASDIANVLGVSRQRVYQLAKRKDFPSPVGELARGAVWDRRTVEAWQHRPGRANKKKATA